MIGGGKRPEDFISPADGKCRAAKNFNGVNFSQFRVFQHPALFNPLVGDRVADPNHRVVGKKPQRQIARAGAPRGNSSFAVARSGRVFDAGYPIRRTQVNVDCRLERFKCRGEITRDIGNFPQNRVVAD